MKFIAASVLLLSCLLSPANTSGDFRGVVAEPDAILSDDTIYEDGVHRNLQRWNYQQLSWWGYIVQNTIPGTVNLKKCRNKQFPPVSGTTCSPRAKTCHFGEQTCLGIGAADCPAAGPYPATACFCDGAGSWGTWTCLPAYCPPDPCAGPFPPAPGGPCSICGSVTDDTDDDDVGDEPLSDVLMELLDAAGYLLATPLTDANGDYCFADLEAPEVYTIRETNPPGYDDVSDIDGVNLSEITVDFPLECTDSTGNDFVDEKRSCLISICGSVTDDTDNEGEGDEPLAAVQL